MRYGGGGVIGQMGKECETPITRERIPSLTCYVSIVQCFPFTAFRFFFLKMLINCTGIVPTLFCYILVSVLNYLI